MFEWCPQYSSPRTGHKMSGIIQPENLPISCAAGLGCKCVSRSRAGSTANSSDCLEKNAGRRTEERPLRRGNSSCFIECMLGQTRQKDNTCSYDDATKSLHLWISCLNSTNVEKPATEQWGPEKMVGGRAHLKPDMTT